MSAEHPVTQSLFGRVPRVLFAFPALCFVLAVALFSHGSYEWSYEAPFVLLILNTLFLVASPLVASYLAARSTMASGSSTTLLMGCSLLTMAASSFSAGWVRGESGGANDTIIIHNVGFLLASLFSFAAAWISLSESSRLKVLTTRRSRIVPACYSGVVLFVAFLTLATAYHLTPVFFIQNQGPTLLRQIILSLAVTFFAISSLMFFQLHQKSRAQFLFWYCLALVLIAQGLGILLFQRSLGSPINWLGRSFQYLGGVCFLIALVEGSREAHARGASFVELLPAMVDISRLWETEEALRQSEERFRALAEATFEGIAITEDGRFADVNEQFCWLTKYDRSELVGKEVALLLPPEEHRRVMENITSGRDSITEHLLVRKDGEVITVEAHGKTVRAGKRSLRYTAVRDITEQKEAREALLSAKAEAECKAREAQEGKRILDALMKYIPEGITIASAPDVLTTHTSTYAHDLLARGGDSAAGFSMQEWVARVEYFLPDGDAPAQVEDLPLWRAVKLGETVMGQELVLRNPKGYLLPVLCNAGPIRDSDGNIVGGVVAWRDISDRKKSEKDLRESEQNYRELVQNANSAIIRWRSDGTITFFNEYAQSFFGYREDEVIGKHVGLLVPQTESNGKDLTKLVQDIVSHPERYVQNINENIRRDGTRVWMAWTNKPVFDANGEVSEILAVGTDITERKQAERAREQRIEDLNTLISVGSNVLASGSMQELLDKVVDAARLLTGAKIGTSGHGYKEGHFRVGATSKSEDSPPCPPGSLFAVERGGVYLDLIETAESIRMNGEDFSSHPLWWGLPEGHTPLRGLLGARLTDRDGEAKGLIMVSQREQGEFTEEDELLLKQLASIASIGLQHLEAREALVKAHDELEVRVLERTAELTRTNEVLDRQREVLQTIIDNIPVMLCSYDPKGRVQLVSRELERLLGWSFEDMRREDFDIMDECYPDPQYRKMVWEYMMEAAPGWRDLTMRTRSGEVIEGSWANVRLSDGSQIGIGLDITERKRAELALRESEERFRLITESIQDVFWMSTPGVEKMLYVSPAYETIWGRTRESLYAEPRSFIKVVHPDDRALVLSQLTEHSKGSWECQYRIIQTGGAVRWIDDRGFPIHDESGKLRLMTGIATDITDRKRTEEELALYTKKLQESNQALQDFASIASHDLQEPLRKVTSFGNMLKQRYGNSLGEGGRDYLDRMLGATKRMDSLLKALLDYSRVSTRAEPFKEVDLSVLVGEVLSDLEWRIEKTGGEVQVGDVPTIQADPTQMRQLFQNLIGNALKFHKEGEKPVVKVHCSFNGPDRCEITVEDNGIGFEEKDLERIFAPFQRLHGRSSQYEGTGMGLAICKKIVERHGGTITAKSEPGLGSRFIITFPGKSG